MAQIFNHKTIFQNSFVAQNMLLDGRQSTVIRFTTLVFATDNNTTGAAVAARKRYCTRYYYAT